MADRLTRLWKQGSPEAGYNLAGLYTGLGNKDRAMEWFERAYQDHCSFVRPTGIDPVFAGLRPDPRFQALLRRLNFPM